MKDLLQMIAMFIALTISLTVLIIGLSFAFKVAEIIYPPDVESSN